jgi:hypothetical protein
MITLLSLYTDYVSVVSKEYITVLLTIAIPGIGGWICKGEERLYESGDIDYAEFRAYTKGSQKQITMSNRKSIKKILLLQTK